MALADDRVAKANLALLVGRAFKARKLTHMLAAKLFGLNQPKICSIVNGRLGGLSAERQIRFLNDLGCDVVISVSAPDREHLGHVVPEGTLRSFDRCMYTFRVSG